MKAIKHSLVKMGLLGILLGSIPSSSLQAWNRAFFQPLNDTFSQVDNWGDRGNTTLSMYEKGDKIIVEAPLPGIEEADIDITLEKGVLAITGGRKKSEEKEKQDEKYYYRASSRFSYQVALPETADLTDPKATFKNGMMTVEFKKKQSTEPRKIQFNK